MYCTLKGYNSVYVGVLPTLRQISRVPFRQTFFCFGTTMAADGSGGEDHYFFRLLCTTNLKEKENLLIRKTFPSRQNCFGRRRRTVSLYQPS